MSVYWSAVWERFMRHRPAMVGLVVLFLLCGFALAAPWFSAYTYFQADLTHQNLPPSWDHWFGTDEFGRDLFVRVWYGARLSLFVGIAAALIDLCIGALWGGIAALAGGKTEEIMMRIADVLFTVPYLLVVILLMIVLGSGLIPILIAITLIGWISMARIVRGQVLQLKQQEFVLAAIALGARFPRLLFRHLLPNALGPIIVTTTLTIPAAIFTEAFLSFLGLGVQAPFASWGTMANDALPALNYYPWRLFFPAFFISITMLAFNLVGDGLRDSLDPRGRA